MSRRAPKPREIVARLRPSPEDRPPFLEGLALGAMVGAAIAGSTLWARFRERRARVGSDSNARIRPQAG